MRIRLQFRSVHHEVPVGSTGWIVGGCGFIYQHGAVRLLMRRLHLLIVMRSRTAAEWATFGQ